MSLEAVWDLRRPVVVPGSHHHHNSTSSASSSSTPRCLVVYPMMIPGTVNTGPTTTGTSTSTGSSMSTHPQPQQRAATTTNTTTSSITTNPFDVPFTSFNSVTSSTSHNHNNNNSRLQQHPSHPTYRPIMAVLFGTDRGTLHFRTYEYPHSTTTTVVPLSSMSTGTMTAVLPPPQWPIGLSTMVPHSPPSSSSSSLLGVRNILPIDGILTSSSSLSLSLPGPIIACIPLFDTTQAVVVTPGPGGGVYRSSHNNNNNVNHISNSSSSRKQQQQQLLLQQQSPPQSFLLLLDDERSDQTNTPHPSGSTDTAVVPSATTTTNSTNIKTYATMIVIVGSSSSPNNTTTNKNGSFMSMSSVSGNHNQQPNGFQIVASSSSSASASSTTTTGVPILPRMSCAAAAHYSMQRMTTIPGPSPCVYGVGRTLQTTTPFQMMKYTGGSGTTTHHTAGTTHAMTTGTTNQPPQLVFIHSNHQQQQQHHPTILQLPHPGVRSGPDAMLVIGNANTSSSSSPVVMVAVANTFYAVIGTYIHQESHDNPETSSLSSSSLSINNTTTAITSSSTKTDNLIKVLSFQQSSQVYPVMILNLYDRSFVEPDWYSIFLACGRECAVVDVHVTKMNDLPSSSLSTTTVPHQNDTSDSTTFLTCSPPRNGIVTVTSPILSAASSWPYVVLLQSDGLVSIRSTSCLAISLRTIEVGQRPNDYFILRSVSSSPKISHHFVSNTSGGSGSGMNQSSSESTTLPYIVAMAYSGECKVLQCQPDTLQDFADRMMRHAIDAFGTNGFPRVELAEALNVSFAATSYTNPITTTGSGGEIPTLQARNVFKQYLEAVLGLTDFDGGSCSGWPMDFVITANGDVHHGSYPTSGSTSASMTKTRETGGIGLAGRGPLTPVVGSASSSSSAALLCATALLCLVCSHLSPPNASLANRAAKTCSERIGVLLEEELMINKATIQLCELIAEKVLREASSKFSLSASASPTPIARVNRNTQSTSVTLFLESSIWLLRSCGKHERAIEVTYERLQQQGQQQLQQSDTTDGGAGALVRGFWSQIKYESYTATHLSELWSTGKEIGCQLVLSSPATHRLLERNPRLGLSVFTAMHPQNETQWSSSSKRDDPLSNPNRVHQVLRLLKSINPLVSTDKERTSSNDGSTVLPLESGRALAVSFLRSAIGISTGRPADLIDTYEHNPLDPEYEQHVSNIHDELALLLLEGVIVERSDDRVELLPTETNNPEDNELGSIYRAMLRELLQWPLTKIRPDQFMEALPPTFLQEKALVLGRLGQHEDALRILYGELNSLDLALAYCDHRYNRQKVQYERARIRQQKQLYQNASMYSDLDQSDDFDLKGDDNAYIPLIRVALDSVNTERGTATAIKVLALRRGAVDRAAALRLLPSDVPVSAVARPFLIPALVESESQVRRMTVVSALLKSRYLRLKDKLTTAQLKAQAHIHIVPALRSLNLGEPLHSTKSTRARTTNVTPSSTMPYIEIVKFFFPRHLVIQAKVTNVPYSSYPSSVPPFADKAGNVPNASTTTTSALSDITFVVAESSDEEAITPMLQVPIQLLPHKMTGSAWCVLSAIPSNMDAPTAQLTCELRYSVQQSNVVNTTNANSYMDNANNFTSSSSNYNSSMMIASTRTFVEELQDLEIHATHFLPKSAH